MESKWYTYSKNPKISLKTNIILLLIMFVIVAPILYSHYKKYPFLAKDSESIHSKIIAKETWLRGAPLYIFSNKEKIAIAYIPFENDSLNKIYPNKPYYTTLYGFIEIGDSISYTKGSNQILVYRNNYKIVFTKEK